MSYRPRDRYRDVLVGLLLGLMLCVAPRVQGQILRGEWVNQTERAIDQHRKSDVLVIVLDREDRAVENAKVRITQTRHAFKLGLTIPAQGAPPASARELPLYRCFNALALDRLTRWTTPDRHWPEPIREQINHWASTLEPIELAFGPVIASDPANNFDGLAKLEPSFVGELLSQRVAAALELDQRVHKFDLYHDTAGTADLRADLGFGVIHRLFEQAHATDHDATHSLRFVNGLDAMGSREIAPRVQSYEVRRVPFTGITIEQQFTGQVQPLALQRTLKDRIAILPAPVTIARFEAGGNSQIAAALNLETILRLLFAEPSINAIYFAGLTEDQHLETNAALIEADGALTASGQLVDDLFAKHWWSNIEAVTDDRGNAMARVFKGWYDIEAVLPDGTVLKTAAYIDAAEGDAHTVVLQKTAVD